MRMRSSASKAFRTNRGKLNGGSGRVTLATLGRTHGVGGRETHSRVRLFSHHSLATPAPEAPHHAGGILVGGVKQRFLLT